MVPSMAVDVLRRSMAFSLALGYAQTPQFVLLYSGVQ